MIAFAVLGLNLMGDGLRDVLDPRQPDAATDRAPEHGGGCCGPQIAAGPRLADRVAPAGRGPRGHAVWLPETVSFIGTDRPLLPADGEAPRRRLRLAGFGIEPVAISNDRFAAFVAASGYVTEAERIGWSFVFRNFLPEAAARERVPSVTAPWWLRVDGACWSCPEGPGSSVAGRGNHPVVHVSWSDARAFAAWVGGRLPTEAEWEHAARGGRDGIYPWGDRAPDDQGFFPANIWQGRFPQRDLALDGHAGTAPVDALAPNDFGLFNMAGNVWEWCEDRFRVRSLSRAARARNDQARRESHRVMKGGSYLCHQSYCHRYRIAARQGLPPDSATGHLGFRVAYSDPAQS